MKGTVIYLALLKLKSEGGPHGLKAGISGHDENVFENQSQTHAWISSQQIALKIKKALKPVESHR